FTAISRRPRRQHGVEPVAQPLLLQRRLLAQRAERPGGRGSQGGRGRRRLEQRGNDQDGMGCDHTICELRVECVVRYALLPSPTVSYRLLPSPTVRAIRSQASSASATSAPIVSFLKWSTASAPCRFSSY